MSDIVTVNVSQILAPTPSALQKTGAFVSQGGTVETPGSTTFIAELDDLTPLLIALAPITSATWSGTTAQLATITTTQAHGLTHNNVYEVDIEGVVSTTIGAYDGVWPVTVTGNDTFTYVLPLTGAPGSGTGGTWTPESRNEVLQMATTFFGQGSSQGAYILELGPGNASQGVSGLSAYITANSDPQKFYSYLVPREWDGNSDYLALIDQFENTTSKTYFFTTTSLATYGLYTSLQKCCFAMIEAPSFGVWPVNPLTALTYSGAWSVNDFTAILLTNFLLASINPWSTKCQHPRHRYCDDD